MKGVGADSLQFVITVYNNKNTPRRSTVYFSHTVTISQGSLTGPEIVCAPVHAVKRNAYICLSHTTAG